MQLIIFSMSSYWEWKKFNRYNRTRALLNEFLKDKRVEKILLVNYLPINLKRALKEFIFSIKEKNKKIGLGYFFIKKNEKFYILSFWLNILIFKRYFLKILTKFKSEFKFSYLISFYPIFVDYLDLFNCKKVFDIVDDWRFLSQYKKFQEILSKNYQNLEKKVDTLLARKQNPIQNIYFKNIKIIPNGISQDFLKIKKIPLEYKLNIPKPIVGYFGIIQERFDINLFEYLIKKNSNINFVVIGEYWIKEFKKLFKYKNFYYLGFVPHNILPYYIKQFDLGIIPHKVNELTKSMDPLKIYELLALEIPIVSTPIYLNPEFRKYIKIAKSKEEFSYYINDLLKNPIDLKEIKQYIKDNYSWNKIADEILSI